MKVRRMWGFVGIVTLLAAQLFWAAPDVPIGEEDPEAANWEGERLATDSEQELGLPDVPLSDVGIGGFDGPFLKADLQVAPTFIGLGCSAMSPCAASTFYDLFYLGQSYSPAASGAISGIDLSVRAKALAPTLGDPHTRGIEIRLGCRQGGKTYWKTGALDEVVWSSAGSSWELVTAAVDLDDATFKHFEAGEQVEGGPNFVNGSAIEFGLQLTVSTDIAAHEQGLSDTHTAVRTYSLGVDDFSIVVLREDIDADGYVDEDDNCVSKPNAPTQCDTDEDGYGNVCDADFDQNLSVTAADFNSKFVPDFSTGNDSGYGTDMDCNGSVGATDFNNYYVPNFNYGKPGPSGLDCAGTVPCPDL